MYYDKHKAELTKLLQHTAPYHRRWQVFSDFVEMAAIALANRVDFREAREQRWHTINENYEPHDQQQFPKMFGHVVAGLTSRYGDFLGESYMGLNLGNEDAGQFFSPYCLGRLMAEQHNIKTALANKSFITVNDPAVGAGGLLIAMADVARQQGINYQKKMHCIGVDIDITAVHMTYIQLSLIGMPAIVIHGNTLKLEEYDHWYTPFHVMFGWNNKLKHGAKKLVCSKVEPTTKAPEGGNEQQLSLFAW